MTTRRMERVNELIRAELAAVITRELRNPLPGVVSITEVHTSPDLRQAQVYISVLGDEETRKNSFAGLQKAAGFLRHALAERLSLRYTPELAFRQDDSLERGARILSLLREIQAPSAPEETSPERKR